MLSVEGIYDGQCVRLKEHVAGKENQRVIVTFAAEFDEGGNDELNKEERAAIREAILTDKCVSPVETNYDVDAFIRESRGYE